MCPLIEQDQLCMSCITDKSTCIDVAICEFVRQIGLMPNVDRLAVGDHAWSNHCTGTLHYSTAFIIQEPYIQARRKCVYFTTYNRGTVSVKRHVHIVFSSDAS